MTTAPDPVDVSRLGIVTIGRNEGGRLKVSLCSLLHDNPTVVYVDSSSDDDSVPYARSLGVDVITLDMDEPFTAARARNAGFTRLLELDPDLEYVMFLDGDCEVAEGWLATGMRHLRDNPDLGVVLGSRIERFPEASIYNRLCDMEWNPEPGEVPACGGDSMMRVAALEEAGRFDPTMIAGEEPELSVRIRECGWRIECLDVTMTIHDAAMYRFSQWWKRSERAGHAYAEGAAKQAHTAFRHNVRPVARIFLWGMILPLVLLIAVVSAAWAVQALIAVPVVLALYGAQGLRVYQWRRGRGDARSHSVLYAAFTVLGKMPECFGLVSYGFNRVRGSRRKLIEYK